MRHARYIDMRVKSLRGLSGLTCNSKKKRIIWLAYTSIIFFKLSVLLLNLYLSFLLRTVEIPVQDKMGCWNEV